MRLINEHDVFDIIDDLRDQMTVVGYWSMVERVKALATNLQPTCNQLATDCISRQAAIDAVLNLNVENRVSWRDAVIDTIDALPSEQQDCIECEEYDHKTKSCPRYCKVIRRTVEEAKQERTGRWIPCSERLPEEYGNYLISIHGEDEPDIGTINPNDKRGWSLCDANGFHWASDKELIVTAWMPLPEPARLEND